MQLRVSRSGFIEGIRALKASQGITDCDVNARATRQEMRASVAACILGESIDSARQGQLALRAR